MRRSDWWVNRFRSDLYAPLEVLADLGIVAPLWLINLVLWVDQRVTCATGHGVSGS